MNNDLIKKIKRLKQIEPSQEWLDSTRNSLISEFNPGIGFFEWLKQPQSFALAFCLILIFLGGPWLTLQASKSSLPGELLYSVKKANEGLQMTVTSEDNKAQLKVEFASRRLDELGKIVDSEGKGEQVKEVASQLKINLEEASIYADKVPEEEVVALTEKTNRIKDELQILTALIRKKQVEEGDTATTTDQEILIFLEELDDGTITTTDKVINGAE